MSEEIMTVDITSQHIVINQDRSVAVPSILKKSIVQHDHNIEKLTFDCPRYWYGKDISTLNIYINYISASQKAKGDDPGSSLCENVVIDENDQDMMHFDWVITNNVSQDVGGLLFLVCAKSVDSDGNEDVHWNSHLCKDLEVREGLEASDSIVNKYPDVIEQIFQRLDNVDGVSPEQIAAAVEEYLVENPPSGMTADEKAQLNKNTEDISQLSEEIANKTGTGLSTEAIDKLEEVGNYLAYTTADGGSKWTELISILRNGSSGGGSGENVPATGITLDKTTLSFTDSTSQTLVATVEPSDTTDKVVWTSDAESVATVTNGVVKPLSNGSATITATCGSVSATCSVTVDIAGEEQVTLISISATYTGGDVAVGTSLTDLTGITVTAHYSDGSTASVTGYTLNGTIAEGSNTITVSYGGKTTTFTVVGIAESGGEDFETNGWTNGTAYNIEWIDGYRFIDTDLGEPQAMSGRSITPFMPCQNANRLNIVGAVSGSIFWYDAEQNYLRYTQSSKVIENTPIPTDAYYFRLCVVTENTSAFVATPYRDELLTETTAWESDKFYRMEFTVGQSINGTSGVVSTDVNRTVSSVGYCYGASTIQIYPYSTNIRVAFYDVDGEYLGSFGTFDTSTGVATVPETAKTFRYHDYSKVDGYNGWVKLS